jgi:hypothetical protein
MLHKTTEERYEKLKRVFARLMRQFNRDDLVDFVLTANSLREWIRRDGALSSDQKTALEDFVMNECLDWQICNQLANHQKHIGAKPRSRGRRMSLAFPRVTNVDVKLGAKGFVVPPSMRIVGAGEEISIECGGHRESALAFVIRTFRHFHYIFEVAPIPLSERVIPNLNELLLAPQSYKVRGSPSHGAQASS